MDAKRLEPYDLLKPDELLTKAYLDDELSMLEARIVDRLTWRMITVMGAWTVVATSLFAFMSQL
jgi:hypothetical protein